MKTIQAPLSFRICIFVSMIQPFDDTYFMKKALQEAEIAFEKGEVPVGAVIVIDNSSYDLFLNKTISTSYGKITLVDFDISPCVKYGESFAVIDVDGVLKSVTRGDDVIVNGLMFSVNDLFVNKIPKFVVEVELGNFGVGSVRDISLGPMIATIDYTNGRVDTEFLIELKSVKLIPSIVPVISIEPDITISFAKTTGVPPTDD